MIEQVGVSWHMASITYGIIILGVLFYFSIHALVINNGLTTMLPQGCYITDGQTAEHC